MNIIKKIEVYGDSILKGIQINPDSKRYCVDNHIDIESISDKHLVTISNYSKFGCTITKGEKLLTNNLKSGISCDAIVMDFGGNDCDFDWKAISECPEDKHQPHTPLDVFVRTYHSMIQKLKESGILPILTTLPPLEPQRFFDWFCRDLNKENVMKWLGSVQTIYRYQENYSRTVEKIAKDADVLVVDLRGAFLKNRQIDHLLCEDGIHPNTEGQNIITATFMEFADRLSGIRKNSGGYW